MSPMPGVPCSTRRWRLGGWAHGELARAIGQAMGYRVWAPGLPAFALHGAARLDRLLRGHKARLTPDRASYMCHPDWVADAARSVPVDMWQPQIASQTGLADTAKWYRQHGWV